MDPRDLFRGIFGFDKNRFDGSERSREGSDWFSEDSNEYDDYDDYDDGSDIDHMFQHFHDEMHKQMEHLNQQMEEIFKHFGATDFPSVMPGPPSQLPTPENPRDKMLKTPEERIPLGKSPFVSPPDSHSSDQPSLFSKFFSIPRFETIKPHDKIDKDLDQVEGKELSKILVKPDFHEMPEPKNPGIFSGHRSVSITTIRGADGKLEHRKTVRDSEGNEETTIRRQVGDKTHTIQKKKDEFGVVEEKETFENMDKDDLKVFDDKWQDKGRQPANPRDNMILPKTDDISIFKKLFGFDFKKNDS